MGFQGNLSLILLKCYPYSRSIPGPFGIIGGRKPILEVLSGPFFIGFFRNILNPLYEVKGGIGFGFLTNLGLLGPNLPGSWTNVLGIIWRDSLFKKAFLAQIFSFLFSSWQNSPGG